MDTSLAWHRAIRHYLGEHSRILTDPITYKTRSGIAKGLKRSGGLGFLPRRLSDEEKFYLSLSLRGKVVYDVGSNEGIFSLYAAREVAEGGQLVAFEPHPLAFRRTVRNLELNRFPCRTLAFNIALGKEHGRATMACPSGESARSTLNQTIAEKYRSDGEKCASFEVQIERMDDLVGQGLRGPDFIKIDTEGHELDVLIGAEQTLRRYSPEIFLELHGTTTQDWIAKRRGLHEFLEACGYRILSMRRESLAVLDPASHLYCRPRPSQAAVAAAS